jgi:hypothetical protein
MSLAGAAEGLKVAKNYVEPKYKAAPESLPAIVVEVRNEIELLKNSFNEESKFSSDKEEFRRIRAAVGPFIEARIMNVKSVENEEERQKALEQVSEIVFENVDKIFQNLTEEDVRLLSKECLPKGFGVKKIAYIDIEYGMNAAYGPDIQAGTLEAAHIDSFGEQINFTKGMQKSDIYGFMFALCHETGHCGDPVRNKYLTREERIFIANKIGERLQHNDRYKSKYVEKIKNANKQVEQDRKATEYFAEITAAYINEHRNMALEDKEIVEFVIKKVDPHFDPDHASKILALMADKIHAMTNPEQAYTRTTAHGEKFTMTAERAEQEIQTLLAAKRAQQQQYAGNK